jgi:opacity protein-like surface antigen
MMRSHRKQAPFLPGIASGTFIKWRVSPLYAERCGPPPRPVMGGEWMTGKFATANVLTLLLLTIFFAMPASAQTGPDQTGSDQTGSAQTTSAQTTSADQAPAAAPTAPAPAAQQPAQAPSTPPASTAQTPQQPAGAEEPADEESTSRRKKRPHDYKNWNFNIGAGANVDSGSTKAFVRGGGVGGDFGVARNANKYLGLRADFIFADLPLRDSTLQLAQASGGASSYVWAITLDPIINVPVTKEFSAYVLFGGGFYHRAGNLKDDTTVPGSACSPFWTWWTGCSSLSIPLSGSFVHASQNEFGYDVGAGIARKMPSGVEVYAEYRLMHGSANGTTTDIRPITIGVRW